MKAVADRVFEGGSSFASFLGVGGAGCEKAMLEVAGAIITSGQWADSG